MTRRICERRSLRLPASGRAGRLALATAALLLGLLLTSAAADEKLYEQDPVDQITLDSRNGDAVLRVQRLDLPRRQLPDPLPTTGKLVVRLVESPDVDYELQWHSIVKIELFEQTVLAEANRLVEAGKFDEAYDYFVHLEDQMPYTLGLKASIEHYLSEQATALESQQRTVHALAVLNELHRRNPAYPQLADRLGALTERQIEALVAQGKSSSARQLLRSLAAKYPQQAVVGKWSAQWQAQAQQSLEQARAALQSGQMVEAEAASRRATQLWPGLPGAEELARTLHEKFPRVLVGVMAPARRWQPDSLTDWASRRSSRLVERTLVEFLGPGTDGGRYRCPIGELEVQELGRRLVFRIKPDQRWSQGESVLTGAMLAQRLLALANPDDPAYRPEWLELLDRVSAPKVYEARADLTRGHVRPQAFLQTTLLPYGDRAWAEVEQWTNGPYVVAEHSEREVLYTMSPAVAPESAGQPRQIVERWFEQGSHAIEALKRRQIDLVDRVNPWSVGPLRKEKELVVEPYGVPLVHCLIPNLQRPLTGNRTFRRALVFGIQRKAILESLVGDRPPDGSQVISGPFSAGTSLQDPLAYAYDETLQPREYDPRLAMSLAEVARRELAEKSKDEQWKTLPSLVLAHPPQEPATLACTMIQKQLKRLGITLVLRPMPPDATNPVPEDVDLVYAELAMWEPIADARRLLSARGPTGDCSPYLLLALGQLEQTTDWQEARAKLRQIHRICYNEGAILPLWQLVDYYARHKSLEGIGKRPVTLYQDVEQWKPACYYPVEAP